MDDERTKLIEEARVFWAAEIKNTREMLNREARRIDERAALRAAQPEDRNDD
jgi:hypothetical protein